MDSEKKQETEEVKILMTETGFLIHEKCDFAFLAGQVVGWNEIRGTVGECGEVLLATGQSVTFNGGKWKVVKSALAKVVSNRVGPPEKKKPLEAVQ